MSTLRSFCFSFVLLSLGRQVLAAEAAEELKGAKDGPFLSRYEGAVLQNASSENFASLRIPQGPGKFDNKSQLAFDKAITAEGLLKGYFYVAPKERTALEVFRNYEAALKQAGFTTLYKCEMAECDDALIREIYAREAVMPRKWANKGVPPYSATDHDDRFISAKKAVNGIDVYVVLYVAEANSIWEAPMVAMLTMQPKPLETGKVTIGSDKLQSVLAEQGKIALYGIYFDTGSAQLKPESKPQLEQMAKLLQANKGLKVIIVGHTDNQGTIETNLALSQHRAEAVVTALAKDYRVDTSRMQGRGIASFAPVASNSAEEGRAQNRRVELVEQ